MASKKLSTDTSLANSYKLSRGVASVARPSAPTIGTATDGGSGLMSVTFTASTLGPTASSFTLTSSSGVTASGASSPLTLQEAVVGTYTYSVSGVNANGTGPSSASSNSVVVDSVDPGAYYPLATTTLASSASTVTFSSIPSTYTHLQIRGIGRASNATTDENFILQFNGDTGANYSLHNIYGTGAAVGANASTNFTASYFGRVSGANSTANIFGVVVADILDYANTDKNKTIRSLSGHDQNGSGYMTLMSGNWRSTSAVTSVTIKNESGSNIAANSSFTLYGIKG